MEAKCTAMIEPGMHNDICDQLEKASIRIKQLEEMQQSLETSQAEQAATVDKGKEDLAMAEHELREAKLMKSMYEKLMSEMKHDRKLPNAKDCVTPHMQLTPQPRQQRPSTIDTVSRFRKTKKKPFDLLAGWGAAISEETSVEVQELLPARQEQPCEDGLGLTSQLEGVLEEVPQKRWGAETAKLDCPSPANGGIALEVRRRKHMQAKHASELEEMRTKLYRMQCLLSSHLAVPSAAESQASDTLMSRVATPAEKPSEPARAHQQRQELLRRRPQPPSTASWVKFSPKPP